MPKYGNFNQLVDQICLDQQWASLRPVIEKELLHYDILFILSQKGFLKNLTFQRGTALRLCYNLKRFSEDLDFVGGPEFSATHLQELKSIIETYIGQRYQLTVEVKEPKLHVPLNTLTSHKVTVTKWQLSVITRPESSDIPRQRVKIEVANIPAYTRKFMPVLTNYNFLPDGYSETFVYVESLDEILADKVIAFAERPRIKARDIWDLQWLLQKKLTLNFTFIQNKIKDYNIENFPHSLSERIKQLSDFVHSHHFIGEMTRFLDEETLKRTIYQEGFLEYITEKITALLTEVSEKF